MQAAKLEITTPAQGNVFVNEPMTFSVQTMAEDPSNPGTYIALTTGRHSVLNVDLTISYDSKHFYFFFPANINFNQIFNTTYILAGSDVERNGKQDLRVRKQCVNGAATFDDIRIITEAVDVRINLTQTLPYYPWERMPPIYNDSYILTPIYTYYTVSDENYYNPGVALSPAFNVTGKCTMQSDWCIRNSSLIDVFTATILQFFVSGKCTYVWPTFKILCLQLLPWPPWGLTRTHYLPSTLLLMPTSPSRLLSRCRLWMSMEESSLMDRTPNWWGDRVLTVAL